MNNFKIKDIKAIYEDNGKAKVGETCTCPSCGTFFVKESYQQKFCKTKDGTKCKDKYWNTATETKRNNTTRISPANRAFQEKRKEKAIFEMDDGWDGHKGHNFF